MLTRMGSRQAAAGFALPAMGPVRAFGKADPHLRYGPARLRRWLDDLKPVELG
jgi:hypothetical protein